ncbi:ABC transporter substrate-binding protein [Actinokineospora diospyrosa]|uniref:Raffinose/stachyose/melibiose transport system substrate-binding protein n=1 Tax=Actinokineospora diospyrosa TaxID=103728 RepID=A0ABT1IJJ6_9PSEU|nr:extracellular solute-binding protein [Actinokineospora diospyrosa]MCP2272814.1 raffinose/stachyose/melibiose transport system substrate-binding protein [Actinokineospora diospyrosa]
MRSTKVTLLALASALVVAGCGSGGGGADPAVGAPQGAIAYLDSDCPDAGIRPDGDKEFTYWSMWNADEPQGKVLSKAIRCFTDKTGVKVNVLWLGRDLLTRNVAPALNTGTVPDLFDQDVSQVMASVVSAGGTQPVEDVLDYKVGEGELKVRDVLPAASYDFPQNKGPDGKIFEIPYVVFGSAWWYDRTVAGRVTAPKTTEELFQLFDNAKSSGVAALAQDGDRPVSNASLFTQAAVRFLGAGGLTKAAQDKTGEVWRNDVGLYQAAEFVEKIAKGRYLIPGWDSAKYPTLQQRWADGEAAYLSMPGWLPSESKQYLDKKGGDRSISLGSFPFPQPGAASHIVAERIPVGFAITAKAKNPGAAKAFIAYVLNKDILSGVPAVADNLTPRADLAVPESQKDIRAALSDPGTEQALYLDGVNALAGGAWAETVLYPLTDTLLRGNISAADFIDAMADRQAKFWKTAK